MSHRFDRKAIRCLPRTAAANNGGQLLLDLLDQSRYEALRRMYLAFEPKNSFQGLPPIRDEVCLKWVDHMIDTGINVIAAQEPDRVDAHLALVPIDRQRCEMLVVVSPGWQNQGIGTALTRCCAELAEELGFEKIWLPVASTNGRARHVYKKCGFEYIGKKIGAELEMTLGLKAASPPHPPVPAPLGLLSARDPAQVY